MPRPFAFIAICGSDEFDNPPPPPALVVPPPEVLAHGLGRRIEEFVREHHGTSEMRSVMDQAAREGSTDIADYRYPGPRPRSRETGVVMIADRLAVQIPGREKDRA